MLNPVYYLGFKPLQIADGSNYALAAANLEDRTYTWQVEVIGNATGPEYVYLISGYFTLQYNPPYGPTTDYCTTPNFHVSAAP